MSDEWDEWDPDVDPDDPWPFTPRARVVIPVALYLVADELRRDLDRVSTGECTLEELGRRGMVVSLLPDFTYACPMSWWVELMGSARRLADEFTLVDRLDPRTIGEQVMLFLALTGGVLGPAIAAAEEHESFWSLPEDDLDPYGSILEALGVADVEFLWDSDFPHAEDPHRRSDVLNQFGVPDMRAHLWHRPDAGDHQVNHGSPIDPDPDDDGDDQAEVPDSSRTPPQARPTRTPLGDRHLRAVPPLTARTPPSAGNSDRELEEGPGE